MKKISFLVVAMCLIAASCNSQKVGSSQNVQPFPAFYSDGTLLLASTEILVEIPKDGFARALGLGMRDQIAENQGMLFLFDEYKQHAFWMKNMRFSIDIVWIKDNLVVEITKNVQLDPAGTTDITRTTYKPSMEVNKVLELKAGWAEDHKLKVGDALEFKLKQ